MSRILVFGKSGQLARSLAERASAAGLDIVCAGRDLADLADEQAVGRVVSDSGPDAIVNAAAYTMVDKAEEEAEAAFAVNEQGARNVARAADRHRVRLIHVSTDYIYDGAKETPYVEVDPLAPLNVYGRSKLAGEQAVRETCGDALILRTAWVYGPFGNNFLKTMLRVGAERESLSVVDDQHGSPTSSLDLADAILAIAGAWREGCEEGPGRTYHCAGAGEASWYEFACEIFRQSSLLGGPAPELEPIPSSGWPTPAARPANSRLDCSALERDFGILMPDWHASVAGNVARVLGEQPMSR